MANIFKLQIKKSTTCTNQAQVVCTLSLCKNRKTVFLQVQISFYKAFTLLNGEDNYNIPRIADIQLADAAYYLKVTARVTKKLSKVQ